MDQIQAMRIFTRVVEAGTFTRAADSLSLPKATVTKHVQALEERLRVKLLNRTTRRVTVTADGAAYYERTVRLLSDLDDIEASMTNARANPMGRLRVDVGTSVAQLLIIPHLADFQTRFPDIQLDLGVSDRTVDLIGDNVDCVIRGGELTDQSLVARRIGNLEFITVASPDYLARKGTPQHPLELEEKHTSLLYFSPQSGRHYPLEFRKGAESIDINGPYQVSVNEANAYVTAALHGMGVAQITSFQAQKHLKAGTLVQLLPDWTQPLLPVYVVYPPNRHLSAKVRAFVDWTAELFQRDPHLQRHEGLAWAAVQARLEANPRASRTVPFVAKATGVPLAKAAARIALGESIVDLRADVYSVTDLPPAMGVENETYTRARASARSCDDLAHPKLTARGGVYPPSLVTSWPSGLVNEKPDSLFLDKVLTNA